MTLISTCRMNKDPEYVYGVKMAAGFSQQILLTVQ